MSIGLLGPLVVDGDPVRLGSRDRKLLSALALRAGDVLSSDHLADAVWGTHPPPSWHKNLQSCVVRLRNALGHDTIETQSGGYRLAVQYDAIDVRQFERLVERARELLVLGESERAAHVSGQALALWRGRPLPELEEWEPATVEATRLEDLRLDAQELWLDSRLRAGHHHDVLADAQAMANAAPLRERRWQMLARAQYQSGRQADALRSLRHVRAMLINDLGLDPGPELDALEQAILRQEPGLLVEAPPTQTGDYCPYPGLLPYDVDDAEAFFGRDTDIDACLSRLDDHGVLAVVGPSGCGKSSLVRAGVTAALRRRGVAVTVIAPGAHPAEALLPVAASGRHRQVLVVDQAEEMFSLCQDPAERDTFLTALARYAENSQLVLALRADRMGDISAHSALARLVERGLYVLAAMPTDELRHAVEGPARQAGLVLEPGLVDLLVREVEDEPGALPLLSHALRETWTRREGRTLTVFGYQESGGIRGAVAQSAEEVYGRLDPSRRQALRDLLLRLVAPNVDGDDPVRARVARRLLVGDAQQDELIDLLVGSRLLTSDDGVVELAHEALARAWPRLRGWLEDDVEGQRALHHLSSAADAWVTLGHPDSELYRGVRLARAVEWSRRPHPELTDPEREFLAASQHLAQEEERTATERARQQARLIGRLRGVLVGASLLLIAALIAGGLAVHQTGDAKQHAAAALDAESAAVAGRAGARALSTDDIDVSLLLAATGAQLNDSPATRANLLAALAQRPQLVGSTLYDGAGITGLDVSPDGQTLAVYDIHSRVQILDNRTWRVLATFDPRDTGPSRERVGPLAFSPAGDVLAVGMPLLSRDPLRLLDPHTLRPTGASLPGLPSRESGTRDRVLAIDYSDDGHVLATTSHLLAIHPRAGSWEVFASAVRVWDVADPERPRLLWSKRLEGRTFVRRDRDVVALSPDGRQVFTSRPLTSWDVATGRRLFVTSHDGYVMDMSPDGRTIAIDDGPDLLLVDASTGRVRRTLYGHDDDINAVRFSTDGDLVASTGADGVGMVWDTTTGAIHERLSLGESNVRGLVFSPDDQTLYTAGFDRAVRRWDQTGRTVYVSRRVEPSEFGFGWGTQAPGGEVMAHAVVGERTRFLDTQTGASTAVGPVGGFSMGMWNPTGDEFAAVTGGLVQIWSAEAELLRDNRGHELPGIYDVGFSGDSSHVFVSLQSGRVRMLDAQTLVPVGRPVDLGEPACCFSGVSDDDTAFILIGGAPRPRLNSFEFMYPAVTWALLDLEAGSITARGDLLPGADGWALSPDGQRVAVGTVDGEVGIIDLQTGEPLRSPVVAHDRECCSLAWAPDGSTVVGSAIDGSVSLWDGATGELLGVIRIPEVVPSSVAFLDDGHTVSIATYTDSVYRWDTSVAQALRYACALAGRNLTAEEWEDYFGDRPYLPACPT